MKLTSQQISAIAKDMAKRENERIRLKNKRIKEGKAFKQAVRVIKKQISEIPKDIAENCLNPGYHGKNNIETVAMSRLGIHLEDDNKYQSDFENDIILASIDAKTMDELMKRLEELNAGV